MEARTKRRRWKWRQTRTGKVADQIRELITSGHFKSHEKLPTFDELAEKFEVSRFTIQNVVNLLKSEGFIYGVQRSGLYVEDNPPHLHCLGLVYSGAPDKPGWPRFNALVEESLPRVFGNFPGLSFKTYFDVDPSTQTKNWSLLLNDIQHRRLAGVVTFLEAFEIYRHEIFNPPKIPLYSVFVPERGFDINPAVTMLNSSYDVFVHKTLQCLTERGFRRLAWLTISPIRYGLDHFRSQGFEVKPHWLIHLGRTPTDMSFNIVSLLMDQPPGVRPDALMLADENLVPDALRALAALGLEPGKDVEVVAQYNWPASDKLDPRVHWLGYSIEDIVTSVLQLFLQEGQGVTPVGVRYRAEPQFLEEREALSKQT